MKNVFTIVGARPQFIKVGPVSQQFSQRTDINEIVVHTGQHFDSNMSDIFFQQLNLPVPQYNLGVGGGSHAQQTANMLVALEALFQNSTPDLVLVYGDTNSTLAGSLCASKLNIPVAHVEAGLRSFNMNMPEEVNRILTDRISSLLYTPTPTAVNNLKNEGVSPDRIVWSGDVMYDAVLQHIHTARGYSQILLDLNIKPKNYCLVTIHRAENTDNVSRLNELLGEILDVASNMQIVLPLHPRTKKKLLEIGRLDELEKAVCLIEPQGYLSTLLLLENALALTTDSGGMQKEALFLKIPCVTLRKETEWLETLEIGANVLFDKETGTLEEHIARQVSKNWSSPTSLFGDGNAAGRIVESIGHYLA